ncbi:hypothetical protein MFIFM68171_05821 [Madurella fahalii]|uniref:DUF6594 domain-containing protein n=1 Tax=Madurella fahalii TaxID=1157608 RepID=A0ABQ0GCZ2_9PEZI
MAPESIVTYSGKGLDSVHSHQYPYESGNTSPTSPKSPYSTNSNATGASGQAFLDKSQPSSGHGLNSANLAAQEPTELDEGWPLLARLMEKQPEFEAFARFRLLNIKNLLYYQVELDYLKDKLEEEEIRDRKISMADPEHNFFEEPNKMIRHWAKTKGKCEQWKLVLKLRDCLHGYNEALLQYANVSALPEADRRDMLELVKWISMPTRGNYTIRGRGSQVWGDLYERPEPEPGFRQLFGQAKSGLLSTILFWRCRTPRTRSDLVTPRPGLKADAIASWAAYAFIPWMAAFASRVAKMIAPEKRGDEEAGARVPSTTMHTAKGKERELEMPGRLKKDATNPKLDNITPVPVAAVNKVTSLIATVVACMLPTVAIGVLTTSTADSNLHKLLWIGGFTALFAMGLTAFTNEISRVQVFMAAAAFSAVLVVFITG